MLFVFFYLSSLIVCGEIHMILGSEFACSEKSKIVNKLKLLCSDMGAGANPGSPSTGAAGESLFTASVSKRKYVVKGNIVRFDKVWSNVGNNYDPRSGVYTSPKDGAFHFSCTVMSQGNNGIRVNLWKNDEKTVAIYSYGAYGGTLNMALDLKRGDRVYIKQSHVENYIHAEPEYHFSMFSGFQIS
ncbi:complement C1q subcomponent subunit B-like [Mytilus edulis]|uniref:complement C1q subcomponent subunit B-like n=1 Tax=Mytilus edulis TaxID=6550 RepID=UPI0039EF9840